MRLPSVAPVPGSPMSNVHKSLMDAHTTFLNGFNGRAPEVLQNYQRASVRLADNLSYIFSPTDVERMILTRRHWLLMSMSPTPDLEPIIHDLVRVETRDRASCFEALIQEFRAIEKHSETTKVTALIAPDTNVYIHQDSMFEAINWSGLAGGHPVRLLVPMQVVRELDKHKHGARNAVVSDTCGETVRVRARKTVQRLRALLVDPTKVMTIKPGVDIELVVDAPNHQPGLDGDAEIIDRMLALSGVIEQDVQIATGDAGMDFAAKIEGLKVVSLGG